MTPLHSRSDIKNIEDWGQKAKHVLFVEGRQYPASENVDVREPLDQMALRHFFEGDNITVRALGPSFHVRSAAEALQYYHPNYYFLIDRDHQNEADVKKSWEGFPDPTANNLLIWPRREFESYFIDPEYVANSVFLSVNPDELKERVLASCRQRLFMDAANLVIAFLRESLKQKWITQFDRPAEFQTKEEALEKLLARSEFDSQIKRVSESLAKSDITKHFERILNELTGGESELTYGRGSWLSMLRGKAVLPSLVNQCFRVVGRDGNNLQGPDAVHGMVKDLVRKPLEEQPEDFQKLHKLIMKQLN